MLSHGFILENKQWGAERLIKVSSTFPWKSNSCFYRSNSPIRLFGFWVSWKNLQDILVSDVSTMKKWCTWSRSKLTEKWHVARSTHFRMRIILRTNLVLLLVFPVTFVGSLWNSSRLHPNLWVQKETIQPSSFNRAPIIRISVVLNSWDNFLVTLFSYSSETCVM